MTEPMNHTFANRNLLLAALLLLASLLRATAAPADFTVVSPINGEGFRLSDAKGKYVALHFLLQTECPYCLRHTRVYHEKAATVPGVVHVFLKPDADAEIKKWAAKLGDVGPTIYRDANAALAKQFNIPHGYRFHGRTVHYPALVLLGPDGREVFRHVGKNNLDRLPFEKFAAKVAELRKNPSSAPRR
jgi:peroxiredoxin Q/BCP